MILSPEIREALYQFIDSYFDKEELRTLCFVIPIDYDSLRGEGKSAKTRELIGYVERHNLIGELLHQLQKERGAAFRESDLESLIERGEGPSEVSGPETREIPDSNIKKPDWKTISSKALAENPYVYGPLVTDPTMFFGRETELDTLHTRLRKMQSTSVVGLRRIGKSSLLYQLSQTLRDELGQNYVPLYIDLQDARYRTLEGFVRTIIGVLNTQMGGILTVNDVTDLSSFSQMMEQLNHTGIRPVLCLDEFEGFMQRPEEFNNEFVEALRALGARSRLAMVTASRTPLVDLIRAGQLTSSFYNIFSQIELGLLEPEAARRLRREPFEWAGITLSLEDETLIEELGGRHPCFLQMACYHLHEAQFQPPGEWADTVREQFNQDAEPHFERLWNHLGTGEKAALKVVVSQAVPTNESEQTLNRLARLGIVEQADGNWRPFSAAFARSVQQYPIQKRKRKLLGLEEPEEPSLSSIVQFLIYAGVATAVVIIAAAISSLLPVQRILSIVIIIAIILPFALVGAGRLAGRDFVQLLSRMLNLGDS